MNNEEIKSTPITNQEKTEMAEQMRLQAESLTFIDEVNILSMITGWAFQSGLEWKNKAIYAIFDTIEIPISKQSEIEKTTEISIDRKKKLLPLDETKLDIFDIIEEVKTQTTKDNPRKKNKEIYNLAYEKLCILKGLRLRPVIAPSVGSISSTLDVMRIEQSGLQQPPMRPQPVENKPTEEIVAEEKETVLE